MAILLFILGIIGFLCLILWLYLGFKISESAAEVGFIKTWEKIKKFNKEE